MDLTVRGAAKSIQKPAWRCLTGGMGLEAVLRERAASLSPAERRVAEVVVADPEAVAFGTVAEVAERADASNATVVRAATRLGFDGFPDLQRSVQDDLRRRLRPATERIRKPAGSATGDDLLARARELEAANVEATLGSVRAEDLQAAVGLLADLDRAIWVLAADEAAGVARQVTTELSMVRTDVESVLGSPVRVARQLADLDPGDVVLVLDLPRYDRSVLEAAKLAASRSATVVVLTDGPLSPLAGVASHSFSVAAEGAGPFDSYVGALALLNVLTAGVADALRDSATDRLDRIEAAWREADALTDD
jgi:DNA-binding MurR/RpiR family transcriptional regulator